ncbi:DUF6985 domain-containing protein [Lentzea chajnantorensis]
MDIPGLGPVTADTEGYGLISAPVAVRVLGTTAPVRLDGWYEDDPGKDEWHAAVRAFLALDERARDAAAAAVFEYYRERAEAVAEEDLLPIDEPADVWAHVDLSRSVPTVLRDDEDGPVYVSIEAECAWEPEHGLQLVFRGGTEVTKAGPYDGHLT